MSFDEQFVPTSFRPYLLRGFYNWLLDNETTPMIQVDADAPASQLPLDYAMDGVITLNVSPRATGQFSIGNEWITFQARFNGAVMQVKFPIQAVVGIWAREAPQMHLHLEVEPYPEQLYPIQETQKPIKETSAPGEKAHPFLRVIK